MGRRSVTEKAEERIHLGVFGYWWIVPYDVPLKEDKTLQTLAVNWTWGVIRGGE